MLSDHFFSRCQDAKTLFRGAGDFGEISGNLGQQGNRLFLETETYKVECCYEKDDQGVISRKDTFENCGAQPIHVRSLHSRFVFQGGEYQVYTQYNGWQAESLGAWQDLVTTVSVSGPSTRTTSHGAPFMALWSEQEQRGVAFHLLPNSAWEMKVTRAHTSVKNTAVIVELGILDYNMHVALAPGEKITMPEILCYEFTNKVQMGAHKLHNYMHTHYPLRRMPVIFNSWMSYFDGFSFELLEKQVKLAADLGVEYFVIDAGWFGKGEAGWTGSVGDWVENPNRGFRGRMKEFADLVRANGMQFGLWLEPERCAPPADAQKEHPEYFIRGEEGGGWYQYYLDFANPEARNWILHTVLDLIEYYGIAYIKNDNNCDLHFDRYDTAFLEYHKGRDLFMQAIRQHYPDIYITNCASGGEQMELQNYVRFDSVWPSDCMSPYNQFRIYKDTLLRMPPQGFERWAVIHSLGGPDSYYHTIGRGDERIVACGDAIWKHIIGVQPAYLDGLMTGGTIGISCDLSLLSDSLYQHLKAFIADFKANRQFWQTAVARRLCDTPTLTVLQYSDMALKRIVLQAVTGEILQDHCTLWPVVDAQKTYRMNGETLLSGEEILRNGLYVEFTGAYGDHWHEMLQVSLTEDAGV